MVLMRPPRRRLIPALAFALTGALAGTLVSGCADSTTSTDGRLQVVAAFYPLALAAEQVGGEHVDVTSLTKPGAEPHDLELTPRQVVDMTRAALVIYESGFQPAIDQAVASQARDAGFDVSPAARLTLSAPADPGGTGDLAVDPHFWLDPIRYADVVKAIGVELARKDPSHAAGYTANADAMVQRLTSLDSAFRAGLAHCADTEIVTGHAAFGYLAERYGLTQVAITGISPDQEPTAAAMSDIVQLIKEHHVTTVYAETLVSPALAETVAREAGAQVAVLDPIEGITSQSAGQDYFAVMRSNLATLETGQQCS
jgi:zinc transport system substrate-binding protein